MASVIADEQSIQLQLSELRTKLFRLQEGEEYTHQTVGLKQMYKESLKPLTEKFIKKYSEGELMREKIVACRNEIAQINMHIKEKQAQKEKCALDRECDEKQKPALIAKIQQLKEDLDNKKESISAHNKANKDRLKELQKSAELFKERLGLEIRKLHGEKLQFVFRYINQKDPERPYAFVLRINEQGEYEVLSCDPALECMAQLQQKVRETNNFSAFLANIRKAFIASVHVQN
ncbi:kinetochore protein Spc25 [Latimeria chalumnae]|uniref:Kinetochore protein SPC25 n=1 Tax=Latimeria chalumnae TaxID=7897 RepID=H3A2K0_LATCH|nr:PREDICTED: kinetochore protein Spc25 isoform X1 [Latimeria chalumnae]|eukprot:XP_006001326.1 PREDICTED: kinetochore protein Spc25 isoform X1 [Latimeria chalumnae]